MVKNRFGSVKSLNALPSSSFAGCYIWLQRVSDVLTRFLLGDIVYRVNSLLCSVTTVMQLARTERLTVKSAGVRMRNMIGVL